jgi:hypothetical protein
LRLRTVSPAGENPSEDARIAETDCAICTQNPAMSAIRFTATGVYGSM